MLRFKYSPPFFSFCVETRRDPNDWRKDTLRYFYYNIFNAKISFEYSKRCILYNYITSKIEGTISDYNNMIFALSLFQKYVEKNENLIDMNKVVNTTIFLSSTNEIVISSKDDNLQKFMNENLISIPHRCIVPQYLVRQFV